MNVLNPEFQTKLTQAILQDHAFLKKNRVNIDGSLFKDKLENEVIRYVLKYYDEYKCTPSREILSDFMHKEGSYDFEDTIEQVGYLYEKTSDIEYIENATIDFVKKSKFKDALIESTKLLDKSEYETIVKKVKEVFDEFTSGEDIGSLFWGDAKSVLKSLDVKEDSIPTGVHDLDDVLTGGAKRGTLNVVITPPNKGKSTLLVNVGKYAVLNGFNVVHYTFELSEMIINRRYMMSMTRMSKAEMKGKKKTAYDKILDLAGDVTNESLIVKRFMAMQAKVLHIKDHLRMVKNRFGFIPDVIIVDYADLIQPSHRYEQRRFELSAIYAELREIGVESNCVVWTASQTNRGGNSTELITIDDLAEDFNKAGIADVIISINQTMEEKRSRPQTARVFFAKNRDDESLVTREIMTDWSRAFIGNIN